MNYNQPHTAYFVIHTSNDKGCLSIRPAYISIGLPWSTRAVSLKKTSRIRMIKGPRNDSAFWISVLLFLVFLRHQASKPRLDLIPMTQSSALLLPPDLLENILVLVVRSSLFPGRTALDISHVCSLWRRVALGCARLWGIIDTRDRKISALFVSRTRRSTPLDVLVANPYVVKPPSLFSKHDVLRGRPQVGLKENPLLSFETVLPCLHNIRFLTLYLSYQELRSFSAVFPSGVPVQLASLTIITPPTWDANSSNSLEQTRIAALVPPVFLKPHVQPQECNEDDDDAVPGTVANGTFRSCRTSAPYLKSLTLMDISLPWDQVSTSLSSLTYFAITSPVVRPSLNQIHSILQHTPQLKRLILDDVFEDTVLDLDSVDSILASNHGSGSGFGNGKGRDLSPVVLPHLTSLTYNAPSLQAHWQCLLLSVCIVAPILDNISFRTPEMGHLYRPVGEECRPLTLPGGSISSNTSYTCKCRMFGPSQLLPNFNVARETFLANLALSIDHLMVSRDAYNPIRGGKGRGYRFYIHGAAKNIDVVEYPSLIPFLRAQSVPFHDPRYFRKFERGILLSGYAYACPQFANNIVSSSLSSSQTQYSCLNPMSELISGFSSFAANLVNVRHLELATGGVEILIMKLKAGMNVEEKESFSPETRGGDDLVPLGAVRHVTLWGQLSSTGSESNVYWRGSDIEKISQAKNSQSGLLALPELLRLLGTRLAESRHQHQSSLSSENSHDELLNRLTLRHFRIEFTPELNEAIENLLGCRYDIVRVDLKKKCEEVVVRKADASSGESTSLSSRLELIDCA